jgi:hypothetical protein
VPDPRVADVDTRISTPIVALVRDYTPAGDVVFSILFLLGERESVRVDLLDGDGVRVNGYSRRWP